MFRLNHLFKQADAVQRYLAAPLTRSRLAYLAHRAEQGARSSTLRGIAALQVKVIHYLELGEQGKVARPDIETAARRWVSQDPARRGGNPDVAQRHFVSHATWATRVWTRRAFMPKSTSREKRKRSHSSTRLNRHEAGRIVTTAGSWRIYNHCRHNPLCAAETRLGLGFIRGWASCSA